MNYELSHDQKWDQQLGSQVSVIPSEKDQLVLKAKGAANVMRSDVAIALSHIAVVTPLSNILMITDALLQS